MRFGIAPKGADAMKNMKSQMNADNKKHSVGWASAHQCLARCLGVGLKPTLLLSSAVSLLCFSVLAGSTA
jgi:hypothetical protein